MPDRRAHRGLDPRDPAAFGPEALPGLREAVTDLSWLLGRGYADASSLKLVGDRYNLVEGQRSAVMRSACSDAARARRLAHRSLPADLCGEPLRIDGFNVLTTIEAALGGGLVLLGRDESARDLAGVHGTYRRVEETEPALRLVGDCLAGWGIGPCTWYLDRPVSNSGRLAAMIRRLSEDRGWAWEVELPFNPDPILAGPGPTVATADAAILDRCERWTPLARAAVEAAAPGAFLVDLSGA